MGGDICWQARCLSSHSHANPLRPSNLFSNFPARSLPNISFRALFSKLEFLKGISSGDKQQHGQLYDKGIAWPY